MKMKKVGLGIFCLTAFIALFFTMWNSSNKIKGNVQDLDYEKFEQLAGFRPHIVFAVDILKPNHMGVPGHVMYGGIVSATSEQDLHDKGWQKIMSLSSANVNPGTKFRTIANFNPNIFAKKIGGRDVLLLYSPYGNDQYLGETASLIFVSAEYDLAFD